ncbi:MAG TPA: Mg2+ transporter-C family protein [Clostridiales bacterium]|nr:Mg2+ transporter-C family protein [Clostridiales bacterium]
MIAQLDYLREFHFASVVLRLVLAMLSGGMIGLERERKRRPAGFRTYILVCLGAALTMLLSQYEYAMLTTRWAALAEEIGLRSDVSRFGAQVINGIGFLGAGTIVVTGRQQVRGLTTAAGLWASACMGLAVGAGFYECVILAFVLIFICISVFPLIDARIQDNAKVLNIYTEFESMDDIGTILGRMKAMGVQIEDIEIGHGNETRARGPRAVLSLRIKQRKTHTQILSDLAKLDCIHRIEEI